MALAHQQEVQDSEKNSIDPHKVKMLDIKIKEMNQKVKLCHLSYHDFQLANSNRLARENMEDHLCRDLMKKVMTIRLQSFAARQPKKVVVRVNDNHVRQKSCMQMRIGSERNCNKDKDRSISSILGAQRQQDLSRAVNVSLSASSSSLSEDEPMPDFIHSIDMTHKSFCQKTIQRSSSSTLPSSGHFTT